MKKLPYIYNTIGPMALSSAIIFFLGGRLSSLKEWYHEKDRRRAHWHIMSNSGKRRPDWSWQGKPPERLHRCSCGVLLFGQRCCDACRLRREAKKNTRSYRERQIMKYWKIIADNLSKAAWFRRANDQDCWRKSRRRKAFCRACRWKAHCVYRTRIDDSPLPGELCWQVGGVFAKFGVTKPILNQTEGSFPRYVLRLFQTCNHRMNTAGKNRKQSQCITRFDSKQ